MKYQSMLSFGKLGILAFYTQNNKYDKLFSYAPTFPMVHIYLYK